MEHKHICDLTPTEFERYCYDFLNGYAQNEGLQDFKITHNKKIKVSDGKWEYLYRPAKNHNPAFPPVPPLFHRG